MSSISPSYKQTSARALWTACQELRDGPDRDNALQDLVALALYNECPLIRQRAAAAIASHDAAASIAK